MTTRAESYYLYIKRVMASDDEEEKQRIVLTFFDRLSWCRLGIVEAHHDCLVLEDEDHQYYLEKSDNRWRLNGAVISDADLCERLGVPVAFLLGILDGLDFCRKHMMHLYEVEQLRKEAKALTEKVNKARRDLQEYKPTVKAFRRAAERQLTAKQRRVAMESAMKRVLAKVNKRCLEHDMPPIPKPTMTAEQIGNLPGFSGVYFEWDGLLCSYVGESVHVPNRMRNHQKVKLKSLVSFIETKDHRRHEHFYIWLMNPYKNGRL